MRKQSGFTLIELMIVVAIIGILAAIAIPAYQDFQVRSKVSEVLGAMGACKTTLGEFYTSNNGWTNRTNVAINAEICADPGGADGVSLYMESLAVSTTGVMTANVQNLGKTDATGEIIMRPANDLAGTVVAASGDTIYQWICGERPATNVQPRYLPGSCQG